MILFAILFFLVFSIFVVTVAWWFEEWIASFFDAGRTE